VRRDRLTGSTGRAALSWVVAIIALGGIAGCNDDSSSAATPAAAKPSLGAEVVQLRRDVVLQRVEVTVENHGGSAVMVERIGLAVPGFEIPGPLRKDEPLPAGSVVNLPIPYDGVTCPADGPPQVGVPRVTLQVRQGDDPESQTVRVKARDADGLLERIATRACAVERVADAVDLRFDDRWRLEKTADGDVLHGTLRATLLEGGPRTISMVAGAVMYGLRPDTPTADPLASLTPDHPEARIPVVAYTARCSGHAIGEIKQPYAFLVWVSEPGQDEDLAVNPTVDDPTKQALRQICAF
jgi:hypothetical protein